MIERLLNTARPDAFVASAVVPLSVPEMLTAMEAPEMALPNASVALTVTEPSVLPAVVLTGWTVKVSAARAPGVTLNAVDWAVSVPAVAVSV